MKNEDFFYVQLAMLLEPKNYQEEFRKVAKIENQLHQLYPNLEKKELQLYLLKSYEFHKSSLSIEGRISYITVLFQLEHYQSKNGYQIENYEEEKEKRLLYYQLHKKRFTSIEKIAIEEITYQQYKKQLEEEREKLLWLSPSSPYYILQ